MKPGPSTTGPVVLPYQWPCSPCITLYGYQIVESNNHQFANGLKKCKMYKDFFFSFCREFTAVAKSPENDTNTNLHKVCCLSSYDGDENELNPPKKTFPLHFSPATKGPADITSVILLLTQVSVLRRTRLEITLMLIELE